MLNFSCTKSYGLAYIIFSRLFSINKFHPLESNSEVIHIEMINNKKIDPILGLLSLKKINTKLKIPVTRQNTVDITNKQQTLNIFFDFIFFYCYHAKSSKILHSIDQDKSSKKNWILLSRL